jgi:hypothetical protein
MCAVRCPGRRQIRVIPLALRPVVFIVSYTCSLLSCKFYSQWQPALSHVLSCGLRTCCISTLRGHSLGAVVQCWRILAFSRSSFFFLLQSKFVCAWLVFSAYLLHHDRDIAPEYDQSNAIRRGTPVQIAKYHSRHTVSSRKVAHFNMDTRPRLPKSRL